MSQSIVDELVTLLGFKVDPNAHPTLHKFNQSIDSIGKSAAVAFTSIMAAAGSILYFAEKSAQAGADIERFHRLTGMSTDSVQQWAYAAGQISGNKESILNDIQKITGELNPLMPGQYNQGLFLMFGDRLKNMKDANQTLREMSKVFQTLTPQKAMQWGNLIGISPETVLLLRTGKLDELFAKAKTRILTPAETAEALKYAQLWQDIKDRMVKFGEHLAIRLFPTIERVVNKMLHWWEVNEKFVTSKVNTFVDTMTRSFERFMGVFDRFAAATPALKNILNMMTDPKLLGGAALAALVGIAGVLGFIAAKWILIGTAVVMTIDALNSLQDQINEKPGGTDFWERNRDAMKRHPIFNSIFGPNLTDKVFGDAPPVDPKKLQTNQAYIDRKDPQLGNLLKAIRDRFANAPGPGGGFTQNNTYNIKSNDPVGVRQEIEYLHRLMRRDYGSTGPTGTVN